MIGPATADFETSDVGKIEVGYIDLAENDFRHCDRIPHHSTHWGYLPS